MGAKNQFAAFFPYKIHNSKDIFNLSKDLNSLGQDAFNAILHHMSRSDEKCLNAILLKGNKKIYLGGFSP